MANQVERLKKQVLRLQAELQRLNLRYHRFSDMDTRIKALEVTKAGMTFLRRQNLAIVKKLRESTEQRKQYLRSRFPKVLEREREMRWQERHKLKRDLETVSAVLSLLKKEVGQKGKRLYWLTPREWAKLHYLLRPREANARVRVPGRQVGSDQGAVRKMGGGISRC